MAQGGTKVFRVDITDTYDPRIVGAGGLKGTKFLYIPTVGDCELLLKQDDGYSTNWVSVANSAMPITVVDAASVGDVDITNAPVDIDGVLPGPDVRVLLWQETLPEQNGVYDYPAAAAAMTRSAGWDTADSFVPGRQVFVDGGTTNADRMFANADTVATLDVDPVVFVPVGATVVGNPNTQAYFDAAGNLASDVQATFDAATMSTTRGLVAGGGAITATGVGAHAQGSAQVAASVIDASGNGAFATGSVTGTGGTVQALAAGFALGRINDGGTVVASGGGSMAVGNVISGGLIDANGFGCFAFGRVNNGGTIQSGTSGPGAFAFGGADNGSIIADANSSFAMGFAQNGGIITVTGGAGACMAFGHAISGEISVSGGIAGCLAFGIVLSAGAIITATGDGAWAKGLCNVAGDVITSSGLGSHAQGFANNVGTITASGVGAMVSGVVDAASMSATFDGSHVFGTALSGGSISSDASGGFAHGHAETSGTIAANTAAGSSGACAFGRAETSGAILSNGFGSYAYGRAIGAGSNILSSGSGSTAIGFAQGGFVVESTATGSWASGFSATRNHSASADGAFIHGYDSIANAQVAIAFGRGHTASVVSGFICGQYGIIAGDELFAVGIGTAIGAEALGFAVHATGRIDQNGSQVGAIIVVAVSTLLDSGTNHKVVLNDVAAGANTLTLPAGIDGLEFEFSPTAANTGTWALAPDGADTIDANVPADLAATPTPKSITFVGGVWYYI